MKTYILILLVVLSLASIAFTQNKPYLLVTVLFYNDGKGQQIVAAGHIPLKVNTAIREDIKSHHGNATAKLVPLFHQMVGSPAASEIAGFVQDKFEHIYVVKLPKWLASKVVCEKSKKMRLRNMKNYRLDDLFEDAHNNDEAVNTNLISEEKIDVASINNIAKLPKTYYMPNTVFYGVETKCKTPTDYSCFLNNKSRHIKAPHYKTFKIIFKKTTSRYSQF